MKKLIPFIASLLAVAAVYAGTELAEPLSVTAATNGAATVASTDTTTVFHYGHVDKVVLDFAGAASPTCTVEVVTVASNALGTTSQTLLSLSATGDGTYYPRAIADTTAGVDISNEPVCIGLFKDQLQLKAYGANGTNVQVSAYIILK